MRIEALQQIQPPGLNMLRRLPMRAKAKPVKRPSKLLALAPSSMPMLSSRRVIG